MALFTRDSIDRLRDAVDMVDLVGAKTDLRRVGSRYAGLCPFHDERTPSFSVNAEEKLFYCFGCQAKGDAFGFVEQSEGLDFPEAVELLADRYGVRLERENDDPRAEERRRRRARLHSLLTRASRYYDSYLWDSKEAAPAREYLAGRGLEEQVLREFEVGYAPKAWDRMIVGAAQNGFRPEELVAAGLAQRCEVQLAYAIGVARPLAVNVETFGTGRISDERMAQLIGEHFDLRPGAIIETLGLRAPIYRATAAYGHFGRSDLDLPWERTDRASALRQAAGAVGVAGAPA